MAQQTMTSDSNKWWIFLGGTLMIFLINMDLTIVSLALATIARYFKTALTEVQWIINSYILSTLVFFIVGGKLSDLIGRKKIFLLGTIIFGAASLLLGFSPNFTILIIGRLLQGIGFALTLSLSLLMIANAFPSQQRGFVLGLAITITGLGQALGPTIGGIILQELSWRWIFLINTPICICSFLIILFAAKNEPPAKPHERIDIIGAIIFGVALTCLLLSFNALSGEHFNLPFFIGGLIITFIIFGLFYWKEKYTLSPLIDFKLFSLRDYTLGLIIRFLFMYAYGNFILFTPLYLQNILGYSPFITGLILLLYSALFGLFSPIAGVWCDQMGYKGPIFFSTIFCLIGFILFTLIVINPSIYLTMLGLVFYGIGSGIMVPSTVNSTISSLPAKSAGEGLGMFFTLAFIGTSLGVALSGMQMNLINAEYLGSTSSLFSHLTSPQADLLRNVMNGTQPLQNLKKIGDYTTLSVIARASFMKGFSSIMSINAILAFIMLMLTIAMKKSKVSYRQ